MFAHRPIDLVQRGQRHAGQLNQQIPVVIWDATAPPFVDSGGRNLPRGLGARLGDCPWPAGLLDELIDFTHVVIILDIASSWQGPFFQLWSLWL